MSRPEFWPVTEEIAWPLDTPPPEYSTVHPPIITLPDGRLVVDYWRKVDGSFAARVWKPGDHPALADLPDDAPKAYRALFLKSWQLRLLRLSEVTADYVHAMDEYRKWKGL
jgi:hypothetical protein